MFLDPESRKIMLTVYKYPIEVKSHFPLSLPDGARILKVDFQGDQLCLWALGDTNVKPVTRMIRVFGTGHPIGTENPNVTMNKLVFIDTVFHGPFVWHVFVDAIEWKLKESKVMGPETGADQ